MRISFSVPLKPISGKHKFAMRLAEAMKLQGIKVTDNRPDINLVFVKGVRKGCKNILRLDGIIMNTRFNYKKKNKSIIGEMKKCDGVIYQNEFCKNAAYAFLGKFKKHACISNGSPPPPNVKPYEHRKPYILAAARWRPHKRLKETVNGFLHSCLQEEYDLIVLGEPDYKIDHDSIIYRGYLGPKETWAYMKGCRYAIHLAWIDWCPNSVVETLVCGKHVLHSETGGTRYLVKDNGIRVHDKKWEFEAIDLYSPPKLDKDELWNAFHNMLSLPPVDASYLDINKIATQYINFCKNVVG